MSSFAGYRQDRDLTQYQTLDGYVRNDTTTPLTFSLELKDYRDSNSQKAVRSFTIPPGGDWTQISGAARFELWLDRHRYPRSESYIRGKFPRQCRLRATSGSLYLDDFTLRENGPSIDPATAPIHDVVERLARRQFMGLVGGAIRRRGSSRTRRTMSRSAALNTTTGVVWNLPSAIRHGWVTQSDADAYMTQLVSTLNTNRNQTAYLPTRFLDLVTGAPVTDHEESSIDASFLDLRTP